MIQLPPGTPLWLVTAGTIIFLLGILSKQVAEWKNPLGALARWWQSRQLREVERSENLDQAIEAAVKRRVAEEVEPVMKRIKALEKWKKYAEREIGLRDKYAVEVARYISRLDQWSAARGLELPPPPLSPFYEWLETELKKLGDLKPD